MTLDVVRRVLGHSDIKTTSIHGDLARDVMDTEMQECASVGCSGWNGHGAVSKVGET
jgi:hypothetical protein